MGGLALAGCILVIPNMSIVLAAIGHHILNVAGRIPVVIVGSANSVALFLVPLVALGASLLVYGVHRSDRLVSGLFLAIAVPSSVLTFSRGRYLALLAVAVGLAATTHPRRLLSSPG